MKMWCSNKSSGIGMFCFLFIIITQSSLQADIIAPARRISWAGNVGIAGGIPQRTTIFTTLAAGSSLSTVQAALKACPQNQVVKLSSGSYVFNGMLDWDGVKSGVVLRGAGPSATKITFTGGYPNIYMRNGFSENALSTKANLSADATKDSFTLNLSSVPSWVTIGGLIMIDQLDDPTFVSGAGTEGGASYREILGNGPRGMAQINRVVAKTATSITVEVPLYYGWQVSRTAQICQPGFDPSTSRALSYCGIEDLYLTASYSGSDDHMIKMENCDSCWVQNVEIDNIAGGVAIMPNFSYRCEIRHNYIHHSHTYAGGQGYGVALYNSTSGCLVENNIFQHLHASMMAHLGSSGNVFGYNYAFDGHADSNQDPSISTHGTHTYMNLWEGNFCANKALGDWTHGSSSHNTLLRNRILGHEGTKSVDQTCVSVEYYNRYWNIVGNILGVRGFHNNYLASSSTSCDNQDIYKVGGEVNINCDFNPSDTVAGSGIIIHGNYDVLTDGVRFDPAISDRSISNSYYLSSKPLWFGDRPWPPFDPFSANSASVTNIPAGYRFTFGVDPASGPVNQPPTVSATANPTSGVPPLVVNFSSAGTLDPEGKTLTYNWNFGDGSAVSTSANPSHTYQTNGSFIARLTVSDGTNSTTSSDITIKVGNQPPVVAASASPTSGRPPLAVSFSSTGTSDPEGQSLTYTWNFGDGSPLSSSANPAHTYQTDGLYTARLTVSDGVNSVSSANIVINVSNGLVAAYSFDEGTGTTVNDLSGNGNDGTIGGATWSSSAKYGKALSFTSGALITVNDAPSLDLTTGMTLEAWVNPSALSSWQDIIYKAPGDIFFLLGSAPTAQVPATGGTFTQTLYGTTALPLNTWSHLAATYDGATVRLFVNGAQVGSRSQTGTIATSTGPVTIGGDPDYGQHWTGLIDEVRIYNRALSASEIQADMSSSLAGADKPTPPQNLRILSP
jgi:PKD repeat protein